ncbi:hypothetical protein [Amycolatopsis pittospori]|uniref:hypothetical protein n=1 Tax=Amycolatopsis pittospori TaxID=2749434 RepID=UPI0015F098D9|nr:hypothetical protein [Amycolatopsis pittospori]
MNRKLSVLLLGLSALALPVAVASPAVATASVTCGDHWSPRPGGEFARDYAWGNCAGSSRSVKVYKLTYGGAFKNLVRTDCVAAGQATALGSTTDYRVLSYTGEEAGAC